MRLSKSQTVGIILFLSGGEISKCRPGLEGGVNIAELLERTLNYELSSSSLVSSYRLGVKPSGQSVDTRNILLVLRYYDTKRDIISACRMVKPKNFYDNDDLTPLRSELLYVIRQAKKRHPSKIVACGSHDGKVFMFLKPPNPSARNHGSLRE